MASSTQKKYKPKLSNLLLIAIFKLLAVMPEFFTKFLAQLVGYLSYRISSKTQKIIRINLKLTYPDLTDKEQEALVKSNCFQNAKLAMEFPVAWLSQKAKIESLLLEVNNSQLVEQIREAKLPLIIAVPHIGNWEFFWHWMQLNFPTIGMYSPASIREVDELMLSARQRFGGQPFDTNPKGIMSLMRSLKKGYVMMILPDQVPKKGAGIYTPFFGQPAYTMTLLHRFIQKTGARLLFGSCLRVNNGNGFKIDIQKPNFDIDIESTEVFNLGLNQQIECMIKQAPEQYQWAYKRFKKQPNGINLYSKN
jgi:Kdo2-lipid IVA lauroyltransferase/acyltransferase